MTGSATTPSTHAARASHKCSWCGEIINAREKYARWCWFNDGSASTIRMHPECYHASQRSMVNNGDNEFILHENTRGMTETEYEADQAAAA